MQFTKEDLLTLTRLSRISLKHGEEEKMLHDMQAILQHVSEINEITLQNDDIIYEHSNVVREDRILEESPSKTAIILENAPEKEGTYVKVTQVLQV